jgi:hypothetical protein
MKKLMFLLAFSLGIFISCEKESPFYDEVSFDDSLQSESTKLPGDPISQVHPSILQSDWWNGISAMEQEMIALELVGKDIQVTNEDLQKIRVQNLREWKNTSRAGRTSPGYPIPNPEGNVLLTTQSEVDDFGSMGYTHILGYLRINDFESTEKICDLSPLSDLKSVGSFCFISSVTCARDLDGLQNLKTVGLIGPLGAFSVVGENLKDISALDNLKKITGSLNIISNPKLKNINAFSKIKSLGPGHTLAAIESNWVLSVTNNAKLRNMNGLSNLKKVAGRVLIRFNDQLRNLDDLSKLKEIGYYSGDIFPNKNLEIYDNPNLRNVNGLSRLKFIGGSLLIYDNTSLKNLNGLSRLSTIGEDLQVTNNIALNKFCGLYKVVSAGIPGMVTISGNGTDPTVAEIIADGPCR